MSNETHTQCRLGNVDGRVMVSWIPTKYAQKTREVRLQNDAGVWEYGWKVLDVWATRPTEDVQARSQDYKKQREASDV